MRQVVLLQELIHTERIQTVDMSFGSGHRDTSFVFEKVFKG